MAEPATPDIIAVSDTADGRQPLLAASGRAVAELVRVAYDEGLDAAARLTAQPSDVPRALTYCAERRCDADEARCRTCRLWTEAQGITSIDVLLQRFPRIEFSQSGAIVSASGMTGDAITWSGTLEEFARGWAGEEYWFIARRVQRRVKHNKARDGKLRSLEHTPGSTLDSLESGPALVLVAPQMADNIGMVARAMANFAIDDLRLVAPRDGWPNDKARYAASGAHPVIDAARAYDTTNNAVADLNWVCATTARPRQLAKPVMTPDEAVAEMIRRMQRGERCGVVFGPERTGLSTDDVANADAIVMVRVNPTFASLNLAQAVLLFGYEWLKQTSGGAIGRHTEYEGVEATGLNPGSPPATKADLLSFFEHLEQELLAHGHFRPPEKRQTMVRNMRAMFERMAPTRQEVRTLRGIVASLTRPRNTGGDVS